MEITELYSVIRESAESSQKLLRRSYDRQLNEVLHNTKTIKVLTGLRRAGKSTILKNAFKQLLESGVPFENVLFVNFEHDLLASQIKMPNFLRDTYKLAKSHSIQSKRFYLFLDEIQNVENWASFVRTIYDSEAANIFITGSNSKLLSGEIASVLGGRVLEFEINPLSFTESLEFHEISFSSAAERTKHQNAITFELHRQLNFGGIVEAISLPESQRLNYRQSLLDKIILQDIVPRFEVAYPNLLKQLMLYAEKVLGRLLSVANLSQETGRSEGTIRTYLGYLAQAYLLRPVQKYQFKANKVFSVQPKYFFCDNLLCARADIDQRFENLVYTQLARKYDSEVLFYARDERGKEIDFLVRDLSRQAYLAIQVCWELNNECLDREVSSLEILHRYDRKQEYQYLLICMYVAGNAALERIPKFVKVVKFEDWIFSGGPGDL